MIVNVWHNGIEKTLTGELHPQLYEYVDSLENPKVVRLMADFCADALWDRYVNWDYDHFGVSDDVVTLCRLWLHIYDHYADTYSGNPISIKRWNLIHQHYVEIGERIYKMLQTELPDYVIIFYLDGKYDIGE